MKEKQASKEEERVDEAIEDSGQSWDWILEIARQYARQAIRVCHE